MSVLVDNPLTRLLSAVLNKLGLRRVIAEDIFELFFDKNNDTDRLQKLLYLLGISYLTFKAGNSLYNLYNNWTWVLRHPGYARNFNGHEFRDRYG